MLLQGKVKGDGGLMRKIVINRLKSVKNTILFRISRSLYLAFGFWEGMDLRFLPAMHLRMLKRVANLLEYRIV